MSIATRIEAIEQHLTDDYSVLELAGADLTNVDKNIENLKQSWEERLLYFLANGTDVVWNNWLPKVTGSGETITLNNTIEAKMEFVYKGNTYQETTTGKNLFDNVYGQTRNVYTKHIDASSPLGSLDCYPINLLPNTQYTLKIDMNGYQKTGAWIAGVCFENGDAISLLQSNSMADITTTTFTTDSTGFVYVGQRYGFTYGETGRMDLFLQTAKIQLEKGSTATDWEKYSGGNPTPNPDYPQDIQVVSGDNEIEVCGKNILKYPYLNTTSIVSGVTFTDNGDGSITINGTSTSSTYSLWFLYENAWNYNKLSFELNPGTYTFKGLTTNKVTMACNFYFSDNSNEYFLIAQNDVTKTITNKVRLNMRILVNGGTTVDNVTIYPQIEVGSSSSSFEPYNGNTYPINLGNIELCKIGDYQDKIAKSTGKNLFDYKTPNINQITWTPTDNGGKFTSSTHWKNLGNKLELDTTKQYTFSFGARNSDKLYYYIKTYTDETYQTVKTTIVNDGTALSKTFTPDSKYVSIYFANGAVFNNVEIPNIQLEESSTKTEFEPYLPKGTWYLNKQIGKVVLDGSENWTKGSQTNVSVFVLLNVIYPQVYGENGVGLSNRFKYEYVNNANAFYFGWSNNVVIVMPNTYTLESFKTWLSTHNTIVYYVLATPTNEEITDTTLISQLEAIKKSYNNQTNISQENSKEAFILDVTALGN